MPAETSRRRMSLSHLAGRLPWSSTSTAGSTPDLGLIEAAIAAVAPSVLVDLDPAGHALPMAASVDAVELMSLLRQAGYPVAGHQVFQVPSICCGGGSG